MCLNVSVIIALFILEKDAFKMSWLRNQTPTRVWIWTQRVQGKQKYLALLTALLFMKTMKKKKKNVWLVGETCSTLRLQAALVCTVRKRCSLGNYSKPKQANYKTQCNIGKYKANDVITRKRLQGNSALWFARFSIKSHRVWWTRGRWGGSTTKRTSQISDYQKHLLAS